MDALTRWRNGVNGSASKVYYVLGFVDWAKGKGEFRGLDEMVEFQKQATRDDRYRIVDLLLDHVKERAGRLWYTGNLSGSFIILTK